MNLVFFLFAVASIERGPVYPHFSKWNLSPAALEDVNRYRRLTLRLEPYTVADMYMEKYAYQAAYTYAVIVQDRLTRKLSRPPTVIEMGAAWRHGVTGMDQPGKREVAMEYGLRVSNLVSLKDGQAGKEGGVR